MLQVQMTFRGDAEIAKKRWVQILQRAMENAIGRWHQQFLSRHFTHAGATAYGYAARKPVRRGKRIIPPDVYKFRRTGHSYPLVWTGDMMRQVQAGITIKAMATKPIVTGHMSGPDYLRPAGRPALTCVAGEGRRRRNIARTTGGTLPDMGRELTATTRTEQETMLGWIRQWVVESLNSLAAETRTVTVGPGVVSSVRVA